MAHARVSTGFFSGELGRALRGDHIAQALAGYLMYGPHSNMIGLYRLPAEYILTDLGAEMEDVSAALARLEALRFCRYDPECETVWVCNFARIQLGETLKPSDKRHKCASSLLREHSKSPLVSEFCAAYPGWGIAMEAPSKALRSPFEAPSKPLASPSPRARRRKSRVDASTPPDPALSPPQPKAATRRKQLLAVKLPDELAAVEGLTLLWRRRLEEIPIAKLPTPAGLEDQIAQLMVVYQRDGAEVALDAVRMMAVNGWRGFRARWYYNEIAKANGDAPSGGSRRKTADDRARELRQAGLSPELKKQFEESRSLF